MGMRPPTNETSDASVTEFGIVAVDGLLADTDVSYPVTKERLREALGDAQVAYDTRGRTMSLGDALTQTEQQRFEHKRDLLNALHPVFEARRTGSDGGVVEQVRSVLPF